jgi:hypothetical protein
MKVLLLLALAGPMAGASEFLKPIPSSIMTEEIVSFETQAKFHFEVTAPQVCDQIEKLKPVSLSPRKIMCRFSQAGERKVSLSVCDNAKTFCKPEAFTVHVRADEKNKKAARAIVPSQELKNQQAQLTQKTLPGFARVSPEEFLQSNDGKPVFVIGGTDWCPSCNEAREALLSTEAFQKATADWRRVSVDGDSTAETAAWSRYMPIPFYPSFVLLDKNLREIARYHGAYRLADFSEWATQERKNLNSPIGDLEKVVRLRKSGDFEQKMRDLIHWTDTKAEARRLLAWGLASQNQSVIDLFEESEVPREWRADWLRNKIAKTEGTEEQMTLLKLQLLEAGKETDDFTADLAAFCEENVVNCKHCAARLASRKEYWEAKKFASPAEKGVAFIEDYANQIDIYNAIGDKENANQAAEICVQAADDLGKNSPLKLSRAGLIGESYCLGEAGRAKEAEAIYKQLIASYGSEATFFIRYANFLKKQGRLKEAREFATKALANAYGYNWMKAVTLKAKIEIAMKDKPAAGSTIRTALNELDLSAADPDNRDQRLARTFRELESSLEKTP